MTMTVTKRLASSEGAAERAGAESAAPEETAEPRSIVTSLMRGAQGACPACGTGRLFPRYLKVAPSCPHCGEELYHQRADDAPPYAVILVAGHIIVPAMVIVEELYRPPLGVHLALWLPLTLILCLTLLPPIKGMLVNLQWALRMHGFDPKSEEREPPPADLLLPEAAARS